MRGNRGDNSKELTLVLIGSSNQISRILQEKGLSVSIPQKVEAPRRGRSYPAKCVGMGYNELAGCLLEGQNDPQEASGGNTHMKISPLELGN